MTYLPDESLTTPKLDGHDGYASLNTYNSCVLIKRRRPRRYAGAL
jgi:hypothetical protein